MEQQIVQLCTGNNGSIQDGIYRFDFCGYPVLYSALQAETVCILQAPICDADTLRQALTDNGITNADPQYEDDKLKLILTGDCDVEALLNCVCGKLASLNASDTPVEPLSQQLKALSTDVKNDADCYFLYSGYHITVKNDGSYTVCIELPTADDSGDIAATALDALNNAGFTVASVCYNAHALCISLQEGTIITDLLDCVTSHLSRAGYATDACTYCRQGGAECDVLLNNSYCLLHESCIKQMQKDNKYGTGTPAGRVIGGLAVLLIFAFAGGLSYVLFAMFDIMPALGGIPMGILGALGYRIVNTKACKGARVAMFFIFLLLCAACNLLADYLYVGGVYDFITTYTDVLNIFNTAFDVIAGAVIAEASINIVFDINHSIDTYVIKRVKRNMQ